MEPDDRDADGLATLPDDGRAATLAGRPDDAPTNAEDAADDPADDPAWRLTAWLLPLGALGSAVLTLLQTATGALSAPFGYIAGVALAVLAALLLRDARRRAVRGRWVREEIHEYVLPVGLLLVTLALLARGADIVTCLPALATLAPAAWGFASVRPVERVRRLLPHALPVLNAPDMTPDEWEERDRALVEGIVQEVLDGLPPDIATRLEPWSVEVQGDMRPSPRGEVVFGCCFPAAHVIAIYRRPHLRYNGRGEELRRAVTYTVLHEIAHALGLDEVGVRRLGWLSDTRMPSGAAPSSRN